MEVKVIIKYYDFEDLDLTLELADAVKKSEHGKQITEIIIEPYN